QVLHLAGGPGRWAGVDPRQDGRCPGPAPGSAGLRRARPGWGISTFTRDGDCLRPAADYRERPMAVSLSPDITRPPRRLIRTLIPLARLAVAGAVAAIVLNQQEVPGHPRQDARTAALACVIILTVSGLVQLIGRPRRVRALTAAFAFVDLGLALALVSPSTL